jgi:hypothetical protein
MPRRVAAWNGAAMKMKLRPTRLTRLSLIGALICSTPLLTLAGEKKDKETRGGKFAAEVRREKITGLETRSQLAPELTTVSKEYIRQRLDWLRGQDPRHFKAHAYFEKLIDAGYDPLLLDTWLDGLYDGVVVVGMPADLVLTYYGAPEFRNEVVFQGAPASEWSIRLLPGRVEKVTVVGSKVVRVRG